MVSNKEPSKSTSWKVLETALGHLKYNLRDKLDIREIIDIFTSEDT